MAPRLHVDVKRDLLKVHWRFPATTAGRGADDITIKQENGTATMTIYYIDLKVLTTDPLLHSQVILTSGSLG